MAFIFGIVDFNNAVIGSNEIKSLYDAVKWENFTEYFEIENNVAIGYCSHANRSSKGGIFKYNQLLILADIRIYNSNELKSHFSFNSAEEAFCKAYLKWGVSCTNHINGDFAVVLIDKDKNEVHLFRDHIGVRPLTYCYQNNRLVFASHEFGIAKSKLIDTTICEKRFIADILRKELDYHYTIFEGIKKVNPGFTLTINRHELKETEIWKPRNISTNTSIDYEQALAQLRTLMIKATKSRIEEGVNGVHVSGGLDCTGVAAILADVIDDKSKLIGYSWSPEKLNTVDPKINGGNEKILIDEFAKHKGISIKYRKDDDTNLVADSLEPEFRNMSIEHTTMRMAAQDNVTSMFSGWGGDEFVTLSTRGVYNHLFFSLKWFALLKIMMKQGIRGNYNRFRKEIFPALFPDGWIDMHRDWKRERVALLNSDLAKRNNDYVFKKNRKNIFGRGDRKQFMLNLLYKRHLSERMDSWALYGEKYGIEYKYSLLDKELLEFMFSVPVEYNYKDMSSRGFYRAAMKDILHDSIRLRPDKSENLRIQDSTRKRKEQSAIIIDRISTLSPEHLQPYFDINEFEKALNAANSGTMALGLIPYVLTEKLVQKYFQ